MLIWFDNCFKNMKSESNVWLKYFVQLKKRFLIKLMVLKGIRLCVVN